MIKGQPWPSSSELFLCAMQISDGFSFWGGGGGGGGMFDKGSNNILVLYRQWTLFRYDVMGER